MTTVEQGQQLSRINRIRNARSGLKRYYRPLTEGWRDTKESWAERSEARRQRVAASSPLRRVIVLLLVLAFIYVFPLLPFVSPFWRTVFVDRVAFYVLLALGLNVVVGFAGLLDLGYVAFYAIGAYVAAYFTGEMPVAPPVILNPFLILPVAVIVCMLFGVLLGLPTLRLRGDYLAIVTLGFHEIVRISLLNAEGITNGARGIPGIPHFALPAADPANVNYILILVALGLLFIAAAAALYLRAGDRKQEIRSTSIFLGVIGLVIAAIAVPLGPAIGNFMGRFADFGLDPIPYYYLAITICLLMVLIVQRLSNSRIGRAWVAIREDEIAAEAMGVPTLKMKVWAFAIGASTAGFAGVMLAIKTSFIAPTNFILLQSIIVLAMVVFGGMGSIKGAIAGAVFIGITQEGLRDFDVIPFVPLFILIGAVFAIWGALILTGRIKNKAGRPYGYWLLGIGVFFAAFSWVFAIPMRRIAENPEDWRLFILGLILVLVMVLRPEGLIPSRRRAAELRGETTAADEKLGATSSDSEALMEEGATAMPANPVPGEA